MSPFRIAVLALVTGLAAPGLAQDSAEIVAYLARLAGRGLQAEVLREGEGWLRVHAGDPAADVVRYRVGCAHLALGRDAEGVRLLEPLARIPGFEFAAEAAVRVAESSLGSDDAVRAERVLVAVQSAARGATRDAVLALLTRARLATGKTEPALVVARSLCAEGSTVEARREGALLVGWSELRAGRAVESSVAARGLIDDRAATPAERAEAGVVLGEALLALEQHAGAQRAFEAVPEGPWRPAAARGIGFAEKALGRHAESARAFAAALALEPGGPHAAECALHAGIEALAAGDARGARTQLAAPVLDASADAREWRARAALADGDPDAALEEIARARALPGADSARTARLARVEGEALERAGRGAEAVRAFAASGSAAGRVEAARASLSGGDAESALRHARAALEARPDARTALSAHLALGEAAFRLDRWPDARAAFEAAIPLESDPARAARITLRAAWAAWEGRDAAAAARLSASASAALPAAEREEADFLTARALSSARDPGERTAWATYVERHGSSARASEAVLHLARSSEPADARRLLTAALERETVPARSAELWSELGEIAARADDHAAARTAYAQALNAGAGSFEPQVRYGLAFACAGVGDTTGIERALNPLLESSDLEADLARAIFELAVTASVRLGDGATALSRWQSFVERGPTCARALTSLRGVLPLLVSAGRAADGEGALSELARRARSADLVAVEIERAWFALESPDGAPRAASALARATKAGADAASIAEVRLAVGDRLLAAGDTAGARREFAAATAVGSTVADRALIRLAWASLSVGDHAQALTELERFERECQESPERPRALALRGEALWRAGRHAECAEVLLVARPLVRDAPTRELVLERLGLALARVDRHQEAATVLAEYVREFPRSEGVPGAEVARGRALAQTGDTRTARACLERAISAGGAIAARARLERARIARTAGDLDAALSDALKAALLVDDPECAPEALLLAAEILTEQGDAAAARARVQELVSRYPKSDAAARARGTLDAPARSGSRSNGGAR